MKENIVMLIGKIAAYSSILPIIIILISIKRLIKEKILLTLLIIISVFFEFFSLWISRVIGNNLPLLHIYTLIEFILLANIYRLHLKPPFSNTFFLIVMAAFTGLAIANAFLIDNPFMFNDYARALESIILIFLVLSYFYKTLHELKIQRLEQEPMFWMSIGVLLYFSGSLFIFILGNYFLSSQEAMFTAWGIHAIFSIVLNLFYSIALWVSPKPQM